MEADDNLVECMECHCSGILRRKSGKTILVPRNTKSARLYDEVGNFGLKPHGFATEKQKYSAVAVGTLFWMTIILVANFAGLQELRTEYTFKTLNCGRNFKQCLLEFPYSECYSAFSTCMQDNTDFVFPTKMEVIEKKEEITTEVFTENEQNVNLKRCKRLNFYDLRICQDFCSKTHENDRILCIDLCRQLMSDQGESRDICPFEKLCPFGCPCKFYICEHVDPKFPLVWYHNATDPMFELKDGHKEIFYPVSPFDPSGNF